MSLLAQVPGTTTRNQTIQRVPTANPYWFTLQTGSGETGGDLRGLFTAGYVPGPRVTGTHPVLSFAHLTDPQIMDEASPARVSFTDHFDDIWPGTNYLNWGTNSAYRPHEAYSAHMMDAMVRAIRNVGVGPTTGLPLSFTITTGDMADNNQYNETQWAIAIMDGRPISTQSGNGAGASPTFSNIFFNTASPSPGPAPYQGLLVQSPVHVNCPG